MKNQILFFCFIILVSFNFGCQKDRSLSNYYSNNNHTETRDTCLTEFSLNEIDSIGITHNAEVMSIFNNFDFESIDKISEVRHQFSTMHPGLSNSEVDTILSIALNSSNFNVNNINTFDNNQMVHNYYNNLLSIIDTTESLTGLNYSLGVLRDSVVQNLECKDKSFLLVCISIAKKSALMWAPTNIGGMGLYDELESMAGFNNKITARRPLWQKIFGADVAGAAAGFMKYGFGLAVPGINSAIAGFIAEEAATPSVIAFVL